MKRTFDAPPVVARALSTVAPGRRARIGLDASTPRKLFDTSGKFDRRDGSRQPPEHAPGFSGFLANPRPATLRGRQFRLWSQFEVK